MADVAPDNLRNAVLDKIGANKPVSSKPVSEKKVGNGGLPPGPNLVDVEAFNKLMGGEQSSVVAETKTDTAENKKITAEELHGWYLEIIKTLDPDKYNKKAQVDYKDLDPQQKIIDRFIANKINEKIFGSSIATSVAVDNLKTTEENKKSGLLQQCLEHREQTDNKDVQETIQVRKEVCEGINMSIMETLLGRKKKCL